MKCFKKFFSELRLQSTQGYPSIQYFLPPENIRKQKI